MPWITEMTLKEPTSFHHEIGQHTILTAWGQTLRGPLASKLRVYDLSYLRKIRGQQDIPLADSKKKDAPGGLHLKFSLKLFSLKKKPGPPCYPNTPYEFQSLAKASEYLSMPYTLTNTSGTLLRFHLLLATGTELGTVFVIMSTVTPDLTQPTHLVNADRKWTVKVKIAKCRLVGVSTQHLFTWPPAGVIERGQLQRLKFQGPH